MHKNVSITELHRDAEVAELWMDSKLERISAWNGLRCLARQLEGLGIVQPLVRARAPDSLVLRACGASERRFMTGSGWMVQTLGDEASSRPPIPAEFDIKKQLVLGQTIDRGSQFWAVANYAGSNKGGRLLIGSFSGKMHDASNACKNAMKKCEGGIGWKMVVQLSSICNMPHNPFRSGRWGKELQQLHSDLCQSMGPDSLEFQNAIALQQEVCPGDPPRSTLEWWQVWCCLAYATESMEVLKFARWGSISSCWGPVRPVFFLIGLLLKKFAELTGADDQLADAATTALWDAEVALKKRVPLPQRCWKYVTVDLVYMIDSFCITTKPVRDWAHVGLVVCKSPSDNAKERLSECEHGFEQLARDILSSLDKSAATVHLIGEGVLPDQRKKNAKFLFSLTVATMDEVVQRTWTTAITFPSNVAVFTSKDRDFVDRWVTNFVTQWEHVVAVEAAAAAGDEAAIRLLADISFLEHVLCRLVFELCCLSKFDPSWVDAVVHIAIGLCHALRDEKVPENLHNSGRDLGRYGKGATSTVKSLFNACIQSGNLEERDPDGAIQVTDDAVAQMCWRSIHKKERMAQASTLSPDSWPVEFNGIMKSKDWASPTVPSQFRSACGFIWLQDNMSRGLNADDFPRRAHDGAWFSRLVSPKSVFWSLEDDPQHYLCISVSNWAVWGARVIVTEEGYTLPPPEDRDPPEFIFVTEGAWDVCPVEGEPCGIGVLMVPTAEPQSLLAAALERRYNFEKWQLHHMLTELHHANPDSLNKPQSLKVLAETFFEGDKVEEVNR